MSLVFKQLNDFLADNGLQPIDAVGQKFDPNLHEAIAHEPRAKSPEGTVIRQTRAVTGSRTACCVHPAWSFPAGPNKL